MTSIGSRPRLSMIAKAIKHSIRTGLRKDSCFRKSHSQKDRTCPRRSGDPWITTIWAVEANSLNQLTWWRMIQSWDNLPASQQLWIVRNILLKLCILNSWIRVSKHSSRMARISRPECSRCVTQSRRGSNLSVSDNQEPPTHQRKTLCLRRMKKHGTHSTRPNKRLGKMGSWLLATSPPCSTMKTNQCSTNDFSELIFTLYLAHSSLISIKSCFLTLTFSTV